MPKKVKKEQPPLHSDEPTTTHTQLIEIIYVGQQRFIPLLTLNERAKTDYNAPNGIAHMTQDNAADFLERLKRGDYDFHSKEREEIG